MIKINLDIVIRADQEVVWAFLSDISQGLAYNRFHRKIEGGGRLSFQTGMEFTINHRFFFGEHRMTATIVECIPMQRLHIEEKPSDSCACFRHQCIFNLSPTGEGTKLTYQVEGTYGNPFQDLPFKPVLKGIMIEELLRIKHAVESSEPTIGLKAQGLNPV